MSTLAKRREQLRSLYGFDWPDDLFRFWEFARKLKPLEPVNAVYEALEVVLTGPFDVLDSRFDGRTPRYSPLLHWRYYLDPPEFFTVLVGGGDGHHWGYILDDPAQPESLVASYFANDAFEMAIDGDGLFEVVRLEIEYQTTHCHESIEYDPSEEGYYRDLLNRLDRLRDVVCRYSTGDRSETGDEYINTYPPRVWRAREERMVVDTFEGLGVVVPPEKYRPLKLNDKALRRRLRDDEDIDAVIRAAQRALREGYPGTTLKLGKELWVAGPKYAATAFDLLDAAYEALGRDVLRAVVREHRAHRDRPWLDSLQADDDSTGERE